MSRWCRLRPHSYLSTTLALVKRHPALVPLSHDHHHGLAQAKRLRAGAHAGDALAAARTFLRFFAEETIAHFREEEELLFPLLSDSEEAREPLVRVLLEHQRLHALAGRLTTQVEAAEPAAELMAELGEALEAHIRFEERQLFPLIERLLPALEPPAARDPAGDQSSATIADLLSAAGEGPVWGTQSEDLNATLLVWGADHQTPRHVNEERDVLVVVLAGSAKVTVGSRSDTVRSGQALLIPKGEPRELAAGGEGVRYLSVHRRRPPLQIAPAPPARREAGAGSPGSRH
jgi:quercetin dioxygenase-like cupin family protein